MWRIVCENVKFKRPCMMSERVVHSEIIRRWVLEKNFALIFESQFYSGCWISGEDVNAVLQSSTLILWSALKKSVSVPFHLSRAYLRMKDAPHPLFFPRTHELMLPGRLPGQRGNRGGGGGGARCIHQVHDVTTGQSCALEFCVG